MNNEKSLDLNSYNRYENDPSLEEWRFIVLDGVESNRYIVSSFGNVKNHKTGRLLKRQITKDGYLRVSLINQKIGREKQYMVHRLVAKAFVPNPENKKEVNHINCDRQCNYSWNLEWVTRKENMNWAREHGGMMTFEGLTHPRFSASEAQVFAMYSMLKEGVLNDTEIAKRIGLPMPFVHNIAVGKHAKKLSAQYNYVPRETKKTVEHGFYASHYSELDKLILTGASTKDIMKAYPLDCSKESYRNAINVRRNVLIQEKKMSRIYDTPHKCLRVHFLKGRKGKKGEDCPTHKYTDEQVRKACELLEKNELCCKEIAKITGIGNTMVNLIKMGKNWTHISKDYNIAKHRPGTIPLEYRQEIIDALKQGIEARDIMDPFLEKHPDIAKTMTRRKLNEKILFIKKQVRLGKV